MEDTIMNSMSDDIKDVQAVNNLVRRKLAEHGGTVQRTENELFIEFEDGAAACLFILTWS